MATPFAPASYFLGCHPLSTNESNLYPLITNYEKSRENLHFNGLCHVCDQPADKQRTG